MTDKPNIVHIISGRPRTLLLGGAMLRPLIGAAGAATMSAESSQRAGTSATNPIVVFDVNETLLDFNVLTPPNRGRLGQTIRARSTEPIALSRAPGAA